MAKSDQLLTVLWLLRSRGRLTAEQLAEHLETSVRTVYRYIDALCASGVPVEAESGHGGGYRLPKSFRDAPLFFSIDELKAMVHAGRFAEQAGYPFIEPLRKATDKLRSRLNEEQAEQLERHTAAFEVIQPESRRTPGDILRELELAVAESRALYIHYEKWKGSQPERRKVNPYGLAHRLYKWYLIGHCHLRDDLRVFRADRIAAVEQTEETFVRPESFSLRDFLQNRFAKEHDAEGNDAHQEPGVTVRLQGSPHSISILCDHWYFHDKVASHTQTEATLVLDEAAVGDFLPRHLLSFGTNIRVLEPAGLRRRMAELALELAAFHAGDGESGAKQQKDGGSPTGRID